MEILLRYRLNTFLTSHKKIIGMTVRSPRLDNELFWVSIHLEGERPPNANLNQTKRKLLLSVAQFRDRWLDPSRLPDIRKEGDCDVTQVATFLSPHAGKGFRAFFDELIEYPRFIDKSSDIITLGGIRFIGKLKPPRPGKLDPNALAKFTTSGGSFDPAVEIFSAFVLDVGKKFHCSGAAINAINRLGELTTWLKCVTDTSARALDDFESHCDAVRKSMLTLSTAVASEDMREDPARFASDASDQPAIEDIRRKVTYLHDTAVERERRNRKKGKDIRQGIVENPDPDLISERMRFTRDRDIALQRIHARVKNGEQILAACRYVCRNFSLMGGKKDQFGRRECRPLVNERGVEMTSEVQFKTMARYYRKHYKR